MGASKSKSMMGGTGGIDLPSGGLIGNDKNCQIHYRKIGVRVDDDGFAIYYCDSDDKTSYDVEGFIKGLAKRTPPFRPLNTPLDLEVKSPSFVVIELSDKWKWYFTPNENAVRTIKDCNGMYANLNHWVNGASQTGMPTAPNCRIAYFSVIKGGAPSRPGDTFNLYVQLPGSRSKTLPLSLIIDPDIKNTGGPPVVRPPKRKR